MESLGTVALSFNVADEVFARLFAPVPPPVIVMVEGSGARGPFAGLVAHPDIPVDGAFIPSHCSDLFRMVVNGQARAFRRLNCPATVLRAYAPDYHQWVEDTLRPELRPLWFRVPNSPVLLYDLTPPRPEKCLYRAAPGVFY